MSYLGKISAIVSANTSDFQSKLAMSGKDVIAWSRSIESTISKASSRASASLRNIYTEAQKLERALQAAKTNTVSYKGFDAKNLDAAVSRMQALFSVTKEVNEPLERAARTLEKLPAEIQAGLNAAMQRAQVEAEQLAAEIDRMGDGASIDALGKKFDIAARRAAAAAAAVNRLKEANAAVGGLATGQELRFRAPDFARELARAKQAQEAAAASPTGNFSGTVERQLAAVKELAAAYARMEGARATQGGDVAGTTAAYEKQLAVVRQIGDELEQAVATEQNRANEGAATDVRARLQAISASQRAAQEEASYRQRAAEQAEREAAALAQVVAQQNRAFLIERDRRSGVLARNNSAAFDSATEGLMRPQAAGGAVFGSQATTVDTELARTRAMYQEFIALSPQVQAALESERQALDNIARGARDGAVSLGVLVAANERMAQSMREAKARADEGAATDVRARLQAISASQRAAQEEATYRQRAAEQAEREAAALARVVEQQNRAFLIERDRRSGVLARNNSAAFDAATEELMRQPPAAGGAIFGPPERTLDTELDRTRALYQEFIALSPEVQASLEGERQGLDNIARAASEGSASIGALVAANERMAQSMRETADAAAQQAAAQGRAEELARQTQALGPNLGAASDVAAGRAAERQRRAREMLGMGASGPAEVPRELESVGGRINSLRSQLDSLPAPLRQIMLPTLAAIQNKFVQLAGAVAPTVGQINQLETELIHAEQASTRLGNALRISGGFGGTGTAGITLGLDQAAYSRMESQLNVIQGEMSLLAFGARGQAVEAFNALRNAMARAMADGTIGTERVQAELAEMRARLIDTVATLRGIDAGALGRRVTDAGSRRQGDISRYGVGNASLAVQQLGFAIDDFMSSTGGFDQKLRAISNNISQMAFILGGTRGLFIGLGVTITAQAGLALVKWINGGRAAEDQTKALNDALARQKSLLQELTQAFKSFGDSLSRGVFSQATEDARGFQKEAQSILDKRRERSEGRIADADPTVARERATQAMLDREEGQTTSVGRIVAIREKRRQSQERERAAREAAIAAAPPRPADVSGLIGASAETVLQTSGQFRFVNQADQDRFDRGQQRAQDAANAQTPQQLAAIIRRQLDEIATATTNFDSFGESTVDEARQRLESALASLENEIARADDGLVEQILNGGIEVNRSLVAVQELLDQTVAPFSRTRDEAEKVASRLDELTKELEKGTTPERNAEIKKEMDALRDQSSALRAASSAVRDFADVMKRISTDLADTVAQEARSDADRARREANEAAAQVEVDGEFGPDGTRLSAEIKPNVPVDDGVFNRREEEAYDERKAAEAEARRAQDEADRVRQDNLRLQMEFEAGMANDPMVVAENKRMQELQAVLDDKNATETQKAAAQAEMDRIERQRQRLWEDSLEGRRAAVAADEADKRNAMAQEERRQREEGRKAVDRGAELALTPEERASRDLDSQLRDLEDARRAGRVSDQSAADASARVADDARRSAAPMIMEFRDALKTPSRQALNATDISTTEGARELTRLLRGDDDARNVNLAELQKQTAMLSAIDATVKAAAGRVGVAN